MPHLDDLDLVLALSECLDDPVHAVARQSDHNFHVPIEQTVDQYFPACHKTSLSAELRLPISEVEVFV